MTCTPRIVRIRARIASASATPEMAISFIALAPCNDVYYIKNLPRNLPRKVPRRGGGQGVGPTT